MKELKSSETKLNKLDSVVVECMLVCLLASLLMLVLRVSVGVVKIIRCPEIINWAGLLGIKPHPWLPFTTPMHQTHRTRVQIPATILHIVSSKPVLIPSVINGLHISPKH